MWFFGRLRIPDLLQVLPGYPGWFSTPFVAATFFCWTPTGRKWFFWPILVALVLLSPVNFARTNWFWSIFARKTGFGRKKLVSVDFCFGTPCTGNLHFSDFGPGPGFLLVPRAVLGQNSLKPSYFVISRPWESGCKKVADNHPEYRGNFFFHFRPPSTGKLRFFVFGPGTDLL